MSDYVLVPKEPTIHMVEAVREWNRSGPRAPLPIAEETNLAAVIWDLMLAAAPPAWRDIADPPDDKGQMGLGFWAWEHPSEQWCAMTYEDAKACNATHWTNLPPPPEGRER